MTCRKCGHPSALHRYIEDLPVLKRPCLADDCECRNYETGGEPIEIGRDKEGDEYGIQSGS